MIDENAIIDKLYELLLPVTNVRAVYKGVANYPAVYPAITLRPLSWSEEYADLRDTTENETFMITVYIQLSSEKVEAQQNLRDIIKEIREVLGDQDNIELGGLIDSSQLISGQYLFDQKEAGLYYCDLTYQVRKRFSRF
jgi:hypothetical protein